MNQSSQASESLLELDRLIICALQHEFRAIRRLLLPHPQIHRMQAGAVWTSQKGNSRIGLVTLGHGPKAVRTTFPQLLEKVNARQYVNAGLCGGLSEALSAGCLVCPGEVVSDDNTQALTLASSPKSGTNGRLVTVDAPLLTIEQKRSAASRFGAEIVDMEAWHLAEILSEREQELIVLKAVSDDVQTAFPRELLDILTPNGGIRYGKLLHSLLMRPGNWSKLRQLQRGSQKALKSLVEALQQLL